MEENFSCLEKHQFESLSMEQKNFQTVCTTSDDGSVGLLCHYKFENGSSQFVFLDVENGSGAVIDQSLSFFTENFVQTLASSNGSILLSGYSGDQFCYYVFNPLTKLSVIIPQSCIHGSVVRVGLAFYGSQFEVVLVEAGSSKSNGPELHIYSSETGKWRQHPINLSVPSLPEFEFLELGTPPLYSNGAIHWEIGGYLLVYQVKSSHCELYELPNFFEDWAWQSTMTYRRCLCESGGRVYYCYTDVDGFHIWGLLKEHDHRGFFYACCDSKRFRWRLVNSVKHEVFISKYRNFYGYFCDWEPYKITPIAYSEQAQTIYLQLPGNVVSYNFDTGNLGSICTYSYPGVDFNCCSFLPSITSGLCNVQNERDFRANGEKELNLPIEKVEKLSL